MPRSYATIRCSIWDDEDFLSLGPEAKAAYFMLTSQPDIEACGSLPLTLRRWARYVSLGDPAPLVRWLNELSAARFVLIDKETEELLVRTFAKYDEGYKHAIRVKAVRSSAEAIRSPLLRGVVAGELAKLGVATSIVVPPDSDPDASPVPVESHPLVQTVRPESLSSATQVPVESLSSATPVALRLVSSGTEEAVESLGSVVALGDQESTPQSTLLGGGPVAHKSDPTPWCPKHTGGTDKPCRPCQAARTDYESWPARQAEARRATEALRRRTELETRATAIHSCDLCDDHGYRQLDNRPGGVCNHQPLNPGGLARARAQLASGGDA